jgi:hypothetical protein
VQSAILARFEDGQADKANGSNGRKDNGEAAEDLLHESRVGGKTAAMSQPSLREERGVEEDRGQDAADDEKRLKTIGADVGNVGDVGVARLCGIATAVLVNSPFQEETEEHSQPDEA